MDDAAPLLSPTDIGDEEDLFEDPLFLFEEGIFEPQKNHVNAEGNTCNNNYSEESKTPASALQQLQEAIELIPSHDKSAYLMALQRDPKLVEQESPPLRFLRLEGFNSWAAAKRLTTYWHERVAVFGEDRGFRPLTCTGEGALDEEDIEILETGSLILLPNDKSGRSVMFFDRALLREKMHHATKARLRVLFYLLNIASENPLSQDEGIVVLALACKPPGSGYDFQFPKFAGDLPRFVPIKVHHIHVLTLPAVTGRDMVLNALVSLIMKMLGYFSKLAKVHHGDSQQSLYQQLKKHGLLKNGLPDRAGGNFTLRKFEQWRKRRCREEESLYLTETEKLARKRQVNALHSRQKRERRRIELECLQEKCAKLKKQNEDLRSSNKELEELLRTAREVVFLEALAETRGGPRRAPEPVASQLVSDAPEPIATNGDCNRTVGPIASPLLSADPEHTVTHDRGIADLNANPLLSADPEPIVSLPSSAPTLVYPPSATTIGNNICFAGNGMQGHAGNMVGVHKSVYSSGGGMHASLPQLGGHTFCSSNRDSHTAFHPSSWTPYMGRPSQSNSQQQSVFDANSLASLHATTFSSASSVLDPIPLSFQQSPGGIHAPQSQQLGLPAESTVQLQGVDESARIEQQQQQHVATWPQDPPNTSPVMSWSAAAAPSLAYAADGDVSTTPGKGAGHSADEVPNAPPAAPPQSFGGFWTGDNHSFL